jgi:hypothetical protein
MLRFAAILVITLPPVALFIWIAKLLHSVAALLPH